MLARPGRFQDINIGVKIITVENQISLTPSTNLLLRTGNSTPIWGATAIIADAPRAREIANWCESPVNGTAGIKSVTILRTNALFDDTKLINTTDQTLDTLILYLNIQLGKEVGFRAVKQQMAQYGYTEAGPAHIRMLLKLPTPPKRVVMITTLAFLTCIEEPYVDLRKAFLGRYKITQMSAHNDCIDNNNVLITVIADSITGDADTNTLIDDFDCVVYPNNTVIKINLCNPLLTIAYEYHEFINYKSRYITFSRYVGSDADATMPPHSADSAHVGGVNMPTTLYLNSVDCANKSISMEIKPPVVGKSTDRMGCTIVANIRILPHVDKLLCDKFNEFITTMRDKYCSLFLINFRGASTNDSTGLRKRIPYGAAYAILGRFFDEIMDKGITGNLPKILQERNNRDPQFERLMSKYRKNNQTNSV